MLRLRLQRGGERAAGLVVADHADEDAARAERHQIARDVAGAADHQLAALDRDHRRRRLRRDARHLAVDELVQHQIADAEHGLAGEIGKVFVEVEHRLFVPVRAVEIAGDVFADGVLERREAGVIARPAQILDIALREILVLAADRLRHVDIVDVGRAAQAP